MLGFSRNTGAVAQSLWTGASAGAGDCTLCSVCECVTPAVLVLCDPSCPSVLSITVTDKSNTGEKGLFQLTLRSQSISEEGEGRSTDRR